ncbi:hypothetical protein K431DRAFT_241987 [Polychaeton citri CBS 116435]|uniref:Sister chromatid cohesion protein n=1 Tax=Polychaeton citri CBS 116435 TaxID=1314669 RepID=A0A9P4QAV5_9PEZI|nr:hypothetical protein K431DRAFT_241987 [Polychaeton citri CBS 116435]
MDRDNQMNGLGPGQDGNAYNARSMSDSGQRRHKMPTVEDALPFTPLASIVPFNPNMIPVPLAFPPPTPKINILSPQEQQKTSDLLKELNAGAANAEQASMRVKQALRDVTKLLDENNVTQYKFKKRQIRPRNPQSFNATSQIPSLSHLAQHVMDNTTFSYRYVTLDPADEHKETSKGEQKRSLPTPKPNLPNVQVLVSQHTPQRNGHDTPERIPFGGGTPQVAVIANSLTPAQRAQYHQPDDVHALKQDVPSKEQANGPASSTRPISVDQRRKADVALQNLQNLLHEIFEAEDQLQPDTSGVISNNSSAYFVHVDAGDSEVPLLQPTILKQLDSTILKASNLGVVSAVPTEELARAQKLCENPIMAAENLSLQIGEDWNDQDTEEWITRIKTAESGMLASRTILRIMTAGRNEKELQSEDYLRETMNLMKNVVETCLVPIVEQRPSDKAKGERIKGDKVKTDEPQDSRFTIASANRSLLQQLLVASRKAVRLLGDLLTKCEVDESSVTSAEFLFKTLIFAENAGVEREAALGIQNFEELRRVAMDALAFIFARYEEQRRFIVDEILLSLEKLPPTKQSARQYKLIDAKPIQLVSALLMRLVQTTATRSRRAGPKSKTKDDDSDGPNEVSDDEDASGEDDADIIKVSPAKKGRKPTNLSSVAQPLHEAAQSYAGYIVRTLIQRGLQTSKASEEPYRKLLDIFVEDFINVLGSADWPAAEMLLYTMLSHMMHLVNGPKASVPSKAVALEMLGIMGTGILELRTAAQRAAKSLDTADSELSARLVNVLEQLGSDQSNTRSRLGFTGPYRVVLEFLGARGLHDPQLQSAYGHHLTSWAYQLYSGRDASTESDASAGTEGPQHIQTQVQNMILDPVWLEEQSGFPAVSTAEGRFAAMVVALNQRFCRAFDRIFGVLLSSLSSEQSRIKSRSLKSVVTLLEEDPSVLDRNSSVLNHIFRCTMDASPLVRDSALDLIAKCLNLRPNLDKVMCEKLLLRTNDASIGVRKRAMKLLKDIYLRNRSSSTRAAIASAILSRMHDSEESVVELARTTMEEIWFSPLQAANPSASDVDSKLQYRSQAALLIRTVEREEASVKVLESLIKEVLTTSKSASANIKVCKRLVSVLFDAIIDGSEIPGNPSQTFILHALAIFARTSPVLFTASQLERLEPYTQNLSNTDDLSVYSCAVTILRHVIPFIDTLKQDFLEKIEVSMVSSIPKLPKNELIEVAPCIWTVASLRKSVQRPQVLVMSALANIHAHRQQDLSAEPQKAGRVVRLMNIAGQFGKACDFSGQLAAFKDKFPSHRISTVPALMVQIICAFASPKQPLAVREAAIDNVCAVAQAWPKQFEREDVINAFNFVFKDRIASLEHLVLEGLAGFICSQEVPGDTDVPAMAGGIESGAQRIGGTYASTDADGASNKLAQQFLPQILRLALSSTDDMALTATKLITSIARQGRSHPKESGPALVALETSPNPAIAKLAFLEHRNMNSRFETIIEKEYMRAITQAFEYQRRVVQSAAGFAGQPPASKIHYLWDVLKSGKAQVRKKFLGNLSQRLSFDLNALNVTGDQPQHVLFAQFCAHNLAFLEYDRTDEALQVLGALEKVFAGVGTTVAQAIEHDVLRLNIENLILSQPVANGADDLTSVDQVVIPKTDPQRLHHLTTAAKVLTIVWETRSFVRKVWNLQKHAYKTKKVAKDQETSKAPTRASNAAALTEDYIRKVQKLVSPSPEADAQRAICAAFVDLISTDNEVKVGSGDEDDDLEAPDGQSVSNGDRSTKSPSAGPFGGGGHRKRKSMSAENSPQNVKKRRSSFSRRGSEILKYADDSDE